MAEAVKKKKRKKKKGTIVAIVIVGALLAGGLYLHNKAKSNAAKSITIPSEITVEAGTINRTVDGSGMLQPEEIFEIKIPAGVLVSETDFRVGDIISEGDIIATLDVESINSCIVTVDQQLTAIDNALKDTHDMTEYQIEEFEARKALLESSRERLLALYDDPYVRADHDGIIMTITQPDASAASASGSYSDIVSSLLGFTMSPFKGVDEPGEDGGETTESSTEASSDTSETEPSATSSDTEPSASESGNPTQTEPSDTDSSSVPTGSPAATVITDFSFLNLTAPVRGAAPVRNVTENDQCEGTIAWGVGADEFTGEAFAASTTYTALAMLTPKSGYAFSNDVLPRISGATFSQAVVDPVTGTLTIVAIFPQTEADPDAPAGTTPAITGIPGVGDQQSMDDLASLLQGVDLQQYIQQYIASQTAQATSGLDMASLLGMSGSGVDYSSFTSGLSSSGTSRPSAATPDVTIATIAGTETVNISIMVDELDILLIHVGQEVDIEVDAVESHFVGTIARVSYLADNSYAASGINLGTTNARYQIDISIPMDSQMMLGMSATATITVSSVEDVPVIPMTALQQRGDELFVFGGYDPSTGELTNEIPVTTGVSDGVNVEITSGISEGDVIYCEDLGENDVLSMLF